MWWKNADKLIEDIGREGWSADLPSDRGFWKWLMEWIEENVLSPFLSRFVKQVDEIIEINPELSEKDILATATFHMVDFLGAHSASVRIYDPYTEQMLSYGSYPSKEEDRETYIPLERTVAGEVVRSRQPYLVPDIEKEERYRDKEATADKGIHSMMAIPVEIPRFFPHERDAVGVIQIYFPEKNRRFTTLEIEAAKVMSRRLSFVIARKKILYLYAMNEKKETIVRNIFLKLGSREGVKMKDVFNQVIPELADIIHVESCALFSVDQDLENAVLEAGYPDTVGYHGIGKRFPVSSEPAFELILGKREYVEESPYEIVTPSYLLVTDPQKSELVSKSVKRFAANHNTNSILYIPLNIGGEITHFMTFDALDQRQRYTEDEIEVFLFLGRELVKAQRMEHLDDTLHDFKNPAIATAGFARRLKQLLNAEVSERDDAKIKHYVEILLEETSRLQEMALSIYQVGEEQVVNLSDVARYRFEINQEAIKEQLKQNVTLENGPYEENLWVRCYPIHLERVLDNLLNNATNAVPLRGGKLAVRTYKEDNWACVEITNTGVISDEDRKRLLEGEGRGRGIYITHRIIRLLKGRLDIHTDRDSTTLLVRLPLAQKQEA
ncbi:MAG: GAF domain-containing protein [Desulfobacteraceae bacterium]